MNGHGQFDARRYPVTLIITAIAVALEIVCTMDQGQRNFYYNDWRLGIWWQVWAGELWRPFTTTLLHGNFLHAAFNVYWMFIFGTALERRFGPAKMLTLIVALAYLSMMPEWVITGYYGALVTKTGPVPIPHMVGLSGILYGLFGVLLVGRRYETDLAVICNDQVRQLFIAWFFICIALTWLGVMPVANIAHGAGLAFGWLYGQAIWKRKQRQQWIAAAAGASLLVLATLIYCPGHPGYESAQTAKRLRLQTAVPGPAAVAQRSPSDASSPAAAAKTPSNISPIASATGRTETVSAVLARPAH